MYDKSWDEGSTDPNITEGCMDEVGDSYTYFAWAFDQIGVENSRILDPPGLLEATWESIGQQLDFSALPGSGNESIWYPAQLVAALTAAQDGSFPYMEDAFVDRADGHQKFMAVWDSDLQLDEDSLDTSLFEKPKPSGRTHRLLGNGESLMLFRLRQGVDRFLLGPTSNPVGIEEIEAAIPVMMDATTLAPGTSSHGAEGSNVLFMDGHVEFIRLNQEGVLGRTLTTGIIGRPVNAGVARILQTIQSHDFRSAK
jgi:prepilin-type processing-associated H-X9-DG protein